MSVKLLTDHHLEFLSLKGGSTGSSESCQNATLLEITCRGSLEFWLEPLLPIYKKLLQDIEDIYFFGVNIKYIS